jgi:hypothetical protein
MQFQLPIDIKPFPEMISYRDKILLTGSCFTEHIGNSLKEVKFQVLQNPHGILFGPDAVCRSLSDCMDNRVYTEKDLFFLDELWHSWDHHSRFSGLDKTECLRKINGSIDQSHRFIREAGWVIITLGSAFSYRLTDQFTDDPGSKGRGVANCHRAPAGWFKKKLLSIPEIEAMLEDCLGRLIRFNKRLKFIFTISPVRHVRDGVVENNRSKARLIEAVHEVTSNKDHCFYFPAYELVIDVLRDYRFYDIDLVHPNYAATEFVMEKFMEAGIREDTRAIMQAVRQLVTARKHRAFQPETKAHREFLAAQYQKALALQQQYDFLDLQKEIEYFSRVEP